MVINLSRNSDEVAVLVNEHYSEAEILDIPGVINNHSKIIRISSIDEDGKLETLAVQKYVNFIGALSRLEIGETNIRDFKIFDQTSFWFTQLAEKHDSYHWGKDVWLLYTLLTEKADLFTGTSTIILSASYKHISVLIEEFFRISLLNKPSIIYVGKHPSSVSWFSYMFRSFNFLIKSIALKLQLKIKNVKSIQDKQKNIFVFNDFNSWNNELMTNSGTGAVFNLSSTITYSTAVPLINTFNSFHYEWDKIDGNFTLSYPSFKQLIKLFKDQIKYYKSLKLHNREHCTIGKIKMPFNLLFIELLSVEYFDILNFVWFLNYFNSINQPVKVFYQNEFYIYGRVISTAAKASNNKYVSTYGMQHGLVLENHTVYQISDIELKDLKKGDGLPKPDFFITWGKYFGELFLNGNSISPQYTIAAGNLKYHQILQAEKANYKKGNVLKLLWCTTLPNLFKAEYAIIADVLEEMDNYEICFRLHPGKHIKKEDLKSWISTDVLARSTFSEHSDIFDDIAESDVVITTVFSTAFFDALVMQKKTCRIFTGLSKADFSNVYIENLCDIKTSEDFRLIFDDANERMNNLLPIVSIDSLCYLKDDIWKKILTHD